MQRCRSCGQDKLEKILDLGFAPPSNALLSENDLSKPEITFPLVLLFCDICKLIQTMDFHNGDSLFTSNYPYLSSTSKTWVQHSHKLVDQVISEFNLDEKSLVAEVASNDGYLLERLVQRGIPCYGIEATKLAADISLNKGHKVYNLFLNGETASRIRDENGAADMVIANNVFAHVPNLDDFCEGIKTLLSDSGTLIIEVQYFAPLFHKVLFDTVYHEHYSYFTVTSLHNLLVKHGLSIFKIENLDTHGGSIRVYALKTDKKSKNTIAVEQSIESEGVVSKLSRLSTFQVSVNQTKILIKDFFCQQFKDKKILVGLGAAAKGNTLINFLSLDSTDIQYVLDSAQSKQGKFLPGSHIPIVPFEREFLEQADKLIVLPWNLAKEFKSHVADYKLSKEIPLLVLLPNITTVN